MNFGYHGEDQPAGPRKVIVTGAAGFIGSNLVDRLLADGCSVTGIDNFDPWYDPASKRRNLTQATDHHRFSLIEADLQDLDLAELFAEVDVVFHLAARPGVQDSWGKGFEETCQLNIALTQQILEAALGANVGRVVNASSSSVYGDSAAHGVRSVAPVSPYGVSKAAAEQLSAVYRTRGVEVVNLRFFTVFGPRQRPDMAIRRLLAATDRSETYNFFRRGSGEQRREFTFVGDVVAAASAAGLSPRTDLGGTTLDIGGGCAVSLNEVIAAVEKVTGTTPTVIDHPTSPGDPAATVADIEPARRLLDWQPLTGLLDGLAQQWAWHRNEHPEGGNLAVLEPIDSDLGIALASASREGRRGTASAA